MPVVDAAATWATSGWASEVEVVLVNRFYLRGIEQVDKRPGERRPTPRLAEGRDRTARRGPMTGVTDPSAGRDDRPRTVRLGRVPSSD